MPIYTKTGDAGDTSFIGGRISKASDLIETIGNIDELNASLGRVAALAEKVEDIYTKTIRIQTQLFSIGSTLADKEQQLPLSENIAAELASETKQLEQEIDSWTKKLPELKNFILPGGTQLSANLHHSRAICRRAERQLVRYLLNPEISDEAAQYQENLTSARQYLNRLSDWLFTTARWANHHFGTSEQLWKTSSE